MQDPTKEEIREILEKLADDAVHSTRDLFPALQGDDFIGPSEGIVRLGEVGLLTHGSVYRTGASEIPRGVIKIRITPEGHRWLAAQASGKPNRRSRWVGA